MHVFSYPLLERMDFDAGIYGEVKKVRSAALLGEIFPPPPMY